VSAIIAVLLVIAFGSSDNNSTDHLFDKMNNSNKNKFYTSVNGKRESITFILGEDKQESTPYYSLALDYYTTDKLARTEYINSTCRSLSEVRDYLRDNPPGNGLPWGLVNLVSHGNEWYGMSVAVAPGSKRSSTERISEYVRSGKFQPVPENLLDDSTEIFLHGCGLGNDKDLLRIVSEAFGGKEKQPIVRASKLKEYYSAVRSPDQVLKSRLFYAKTWSVYYKFKDKPSDEELKNEFKKNYPNETIDWTSALSHTNPDIPGDIFYYTINVPVYYLAQYNSADSLPDLSSNKKKEKWISSQKTLADIITKSKIPIDKFKWTTQKTYVKNEKNIKKPAISVTGWCTVLCVVKPLILEKNIVAFDAIPFNPAKNDTSYFGEN